MRNYDRHTDLARTWITRVVYDQQETFQNLCFNVGRWETLCPNIGVDCQRVVLSPFNLEPGVDQYEELLLFNEKVSNRRRVNRVVQEGSCSRRSQRLVRIRFISSLKTEDSDSELHRLRGATSRRQLGQEEMGRQTGSETLRFDLLIEFHGPHGTRERRPPKSVSHVVLLYPPSFLTLQSHK